MCVLDFYVHESQQRNGVGKILFDKMLEHENTEPRKLGYDRPSNKLLGFLAKHYGLKDYVPQNNNFVVYKKYFEQSEKKEKTENIENYYSHRIGSNQKIDSYFDNEISNSLEHKDIYQKKKVTNLNNKFNNLVKKKLDEEEDMDYDYLDKFDKININSKKSVHQGEKSHYNKESDSVYSNNYSQKKSNFSEMRKKSEDLEFNQKENYTSNQRSSNPPWATNDFMENNFASSSSLYGSHYITRKKNNF
jgi:hypothetical protein